MPARYLVVHPAAPLDSAADLTDACAAHRAAPGSWIFDRLIGTVVRGNDAADAAIRAVQTAIDAALERGDGDAAGAEGANLRILGDLTGTHAPGSVAHLEAERRREQFARLDAALTASAGYRPIEEAA